MVRKRRFLIAFVAIAICTIAALPFYFRYAARRYDNRIHSSCGNHFIQLKMLVYSSIDNMDRFPQESDARKAFAKMSSAGDWPDDWLSSPGSACPETYLRDKSMGYLFVADGLPAKWAMENSALIFFCPAESHQRTGAGCHALQGYYMACLNSNAEMIKLLRDELDRAENGAVPYSTNAQAVMAREIATRENYEKKRVARR